MLQQESACGSFVLRLFIFHWPAGILGKVSGEDINRMFIIFPIVSFNMLIHQNMGMEGSALFSGQFYFLFFFLKILFIYFQRERGREGEREGANHQCVVTSHMAPTGDLDHNTGMCPDQESNWQPFGLQPSLNPLSHTSQGRNVFVSYKIIITTLFILVRKSKQSKYC